MRYAYDNLRTNARRRGKEFEISFEYFKKFAIESGYIAGKGRSRTSYHVDRIDESRGYVEGNLQVLTNVENVKKYLNWELDQRGVPSHYRVAVHITRPCTEETPF